MEKLVHYVTGQFNEAGQFVPDSMDVYSMLAPLFRGKKVVLMCTESFQEPSEQQRNWYFLMCHMIAQETGEPNAKIHEINKRKFLSDPENPIKEPTTKTLTREEWISFIENVKNFWEGFLSNDRTQFRFPNPDPTISLKNKNVRLWKFNFPPEMDLSNLKSKPMTSSQE